MKKNKISILVLSVALLVTMAGCAPGRTNMRNMSTQTRVNDNVNNRWMGNTGLNNRDRLNTNLSNGMVRNNNNLDNGLLRNNGNLNNGMFRDTPMTNESLTGNNNLNNRTLNNNVAGNNRLSTRANSIAQRVSALPEVNSASVVINGNTAIVGCDVKGSGNNQISSNLRQKVEAAVRTVDRDITNVSVTSDPNLYSRIRTMSTNITNGQPLSRFANDIQDIIERITAPLR